VDSMRSHAAPGALDPAEDEAQRVRLRVAKIIEGKYGRVEEELMASGLVDSLRAVELALALEKEFQLPPDSFALKDMRTMTLLSRRIAITSHSKGT
jgi:acyl carrier protein